MASVQWGDGKLTIYDENGVVVSVPAGTASQGWNALSFSVTRTGVVFAVCLNGQILPEVIVEYKYEDGRRRSRKAEYLREPLDRLNSRKKTPPAGGLLAKLMKRV